jgi:molybdopterin molybdotransferase
MMNAHLDDHALVNGTDQRTAVAGRGAAVPSAKIPLARAFELIDVMRATFVSRLGVETGAIDEAVGRTLAADVVAARDSPPFDISAMDGYAVNTADRGGRRLIGDRGAASPSGRRGSG